MKEEMQRADIAILSNQVYYKCNCITIYFHTDENMQKLKKKIIKLEDQVKKLMEITVKCLQDVFAVC